LNFVLKIMCIEFLQLLPEKNLRDLNEVAGWCVTLK
jgi:hypothetical protein